MAIQKNLPAPKTSLYEYVAQHNLAGVNTMLNKYGVPSQKTVPDATYCLKVICAKHGENTLKEVADIHPDKYLIREFITGGSSGADGSYSNCSGNCSCGKTSSATGEQDKNNEWLYQNIDGNAPANTQAAHNTNTMGMVMMFSVLALTFAIIYKSK